MPCDSPPVFSLSAWVDESVIVDRGDRFGTYTMAAAIADPMDCADIRRQLRDLTMGRNGRLHWAHESAKHRDAIAATIAAADLALVVVIGAPMYGPKQERARRCCLERLLYELAQCGVSEVWMESRSAAPDRRDVRLVDSARRKGLLPAELKVGFGRPQDEPMLWIPDAVAGAATAARLGEPRWLLVFSEILSQHEVDVR
ncbi:hypothetical protein [Kribbella catacumbae]|uniref:hypothetical protein n=1 Tax=Kribbella catacumbae TaxID=460086 RepID=UPI00037773BF|nr:hypothetical protein [Kribbella catacumbae]